MHTLFCDLLCALLYIIPYPLFLRMVLFARNVFNTLRAESTLFPIASARSLYPLLAHPIANCHSAAAL